MLLKNSISVSNWVRVPTTTTATTALAVGSRGLVRSRVEYSLPSGDIVVDLGESLSNDNSVRTQFLLTFARSTKIAGV